MVLLRKPERRRAAVFLCGLAAFALLLVPAGFCDEKKPEHPKHAERRLSREAYRKAYADRHPGLKKKKKEKAGAPNRDLKQARLRTPEEARAESERIRAQYEADAAAFREKLKTDYPEPRPVGAKPAVPSAEPPAQQPAAS